MQKINRFVDGMRFQEFEDDERTQDAVLRNFEIIGEAANQIPADLKKTHSSLPWKEMYGLRNIVIHHYFGVDLALIWKIASTQIPENLHTLNHIINQETT